MIRCLRRKVSWNAEVGGRLSGGRSEDEGFSGEVSFVGDSELSWSERRLSLSMGHVFTFQDIDNGLKDPVNLPSPADIPKCEELKGVCDFKDRDFEFDETAAQRASTCTGTSEDAHSVAVGGWK